MAERTQRLNLVFALSSLALLLAFSVMIWADYDREWKTYQQRFNALEVRLTEEQIQEALGKVDAARRQVLEAEMAKGEQEIAARRKEVAEAEREAERVHGEWYGIDQEYRFTKADIDVTRYEYDEAVHHHAASAASIKGKLDRLEERFEKLRLALEDVKAREAAAKTRLDQLRQTRLDAEKKQKELFGQKDRLEEKLLKIQPGFVSFVRNLPVLDLANPSLKIGQIMPANLYEDVNFTLTPRVDRCTSCHLGIDKAGYEKAPQPFTTHPNLDLYLRGPHPMDKVGCTVCHQGRGRGTGFQSAAHTPSSKQQEREWGKYTHSKEYEGVHLWDYPMMAKGQTESQCLKCHRGVVEVPKAEHLNTGILLIERYGCYGCHKIKGWENLRKVGPNLAKVASKTSEEWIFRWIKDPLGFRPTRMPQVWDVRVDETDAQKARNNVEANAVVAYLMDKSSHEAYPDPPRGDLEAGRRTFEGVGCLGCHRIGDDRRGIDPVSFADGSKATIEAVSFRTHGPNLDGTGSKVNAGWLYAWIRNPKGYWHETKMPNLRLSEKEAADVTAYLMSLENDAFMSRDRPALDKQVRDGVVKEYLLAQYTVKDADAKMKAMDDPERTLYLGEKTIGRYGCFGCHDIPGFETTAPIGVELTEEGSKLIERLDFGFEEETIPHTLPAWFKRKLEEPRVFDRDKNKLPQDWLRMPKFHLSGDEADAIVTAIMSFTSEKVPLAAQSQLSADDKHVEEGWRLVRTLNCQGCHIVRGKGGAIREVIASQLEGEEAFQAAALAPPMLFNVKSEIGEGARVQTPWLHSFLKDPSNRIRPWLNVRMPTFDFDDEQANTLTRFFAAMDKVPYPYEPTPQLDATLAATGKGLFEKWQCVKCHVVAGKLPNQEPANMAPDLANVPRRLRSDWLARWLADPQRILPGTRMPANFPADPSENAFPEILGGDQKKQIAAVRAYLLTLGGKGGSTGR